MTPRGCKSCVSRKGGRPNVSTSIDEMLQVDETVVARLRWRGTHTGPSGGAA
jgi:hypothetical protein